MNVTKERKSGHDDVPSNYLPSLHRAKAAEEKGVSRRERLLCPPFSPPAASMTGESRVNMKGWIQFSMEKKTATAVAKKIGMGGG